MKMRKLKRITAALALIALMLCACIGYADPEDLIGQRISGIHAPYMVEGGLPSDTDFFTEADFAESRITVVNFWDSSCMNCRIEMPYFQQAYEIYSQQGAAFLGVATRWIGGSYVQGWQLLGDLGVTYPSVIVDEGFTQLMEADHGMPYTLIVDSEGVIIDAYRGRLEFEELEMMILRGLCTPGDVDCDGVVDMSDVSLLFSYLNGGVNVSKRGLFNADANGDGSVNVMDITAIFGIIANS